MFGLVAVLVFLAFDNDLFTLWSLLVFFGVYAAVYVVALVLSAFQSAEYTSYRSMNRQWDVIEAEQKERWEYYKWQDGRTKAVSEKLAGNNGLLQEVFPFFLVGSIAGLVLAIAYLIWG
jgi:Ca2+/Na+ antiporter